MTSIQTRAQRRARAPRGYALLMVLMVLALIALGLGTVMFVVEANLSETRRILGETRCFYALDSASRIASATVQAVAASLAPTVDPAEALATAQDAVCSVAGGCTGGLPLGIMPAGVTMTRFEISLVPTSGFSAAPSGPFKGILVRDSGMSIYIEGRDNGTGRECHVRDSFTTGTVSPFQFMHFAAGHARWYSRGDRVGVVPVYATGRFCLGTTTGTIMNLTRAASGSRLKMAGDTSDDDEGFSCSSVQGGNGTVQIVGTAWDGRVDNINTFARAPRLKLPVETTPNMQGDNDRDRHTVRWLLDPVLAGDNQAIQQLKIAEIADIRIVDGVWYLKKIGFPWPGVPIYSDHPGLTIAPQGDEEEDLLPPNMMVGRDDIKAFLELNGFRNALAPWPPRRYSWYETSAATGGQLMDGHNATPNIDGTGPVDEGIISYGPLAFDAVTGRFTPGVWPGFNAATGAGASICTNTGFQPWYECIDPVTGTPNYKAALLDGARSGFADLNAAKLADDAEPNQIKVLPLNFDVEAFKNAMMDGTVGELGSYFRLAPTPRTFNGIVYITQSWQNSLQGLTRRGSNFTDTVAPEQGAIPTALTTITATELARIPGYATLPHPAASAVGVDTLWASGVQPNSGLFLPRALCGGADEAANGYARGFAKPMCPPDEGGIVNDTLTEAAWGEDGNEGARPNAVRVFHGEDLRPFQPGNTPSISRFGLSVVTNVPLYVLGDWNTAGPNAGGNFPRSMLAADILTIQSPAWRDVQAPWSTNFSTYAAPAAIAHSVPVFDPTSGTVSNINVGAMLRAAVIVGRTVRDNARGNESSEDFIRTVEAFGSITPLAFRGALMVGHFSVFRDDRQYFDGVLPLAAMDFKYDQSLAQPALQPPGAPRFLIGIAGKWKDTR